MNEVDSNTRKTKGGRFKSSLSAVKARLAKEIARCCSRLGLSQRETAKKIGISQPDVSALTRGRSASFSVERLLQLLSALGKQVTITVKDKPFYQSTPITVEVSRE